MYHFVWADQRERQGYKSDVSLKGGIQIICILVNDATLYRHNKTTIDCGFEFVDDNESITLNLVTKCFLTRESLLIMGLNLIKNIESINLSFVGCFLVGVGFCGGGVSGPWGPGVWFMADLQNCSPAVPNS